MLQDFKRKDDKLDKTERSIVLSYRAAAEAIRYAVRALLKIDDE